ncbi:syntabulin-like isoform X2 [Scleropages formosus]|uniref:syntabulin-like isoform X2 n=1 Tax=Scleropages formosus TaxID=113540 RepID=UPI0010FA6B3C|nr:syntabulin-like isoform X2 [Scleropages formosus]
MSPFQEYEANSKAPGREGQRSRIPRPVLRPCGPGQKRGPLPDPPPSEEKSRRCSRRTTSHNSFCSDDTGCPSSHAGSPSGTDNSPLGSPLPRERRGNRKRVCVEVTAAGRTSQPRRRGDPRPTGRPPGDGDFGSSSSAGSSGSKWQQRSLASRSPHLRRTVASARGKEPRTPDRTLPRPSSTSHGLTSTPSRQQYHSCGDNHGIKPPNPEQYLTPLQQKEVVIRHLRVKLKESESRAHEREAQVEELKAQLCRMRDDWIEEECHRVEAQLALKEARREIRQLRHVVETMRSSLIEKDKGIQKYFIDINLQNRKLEALLRSMEAAQGGGVPEEGAPGGCGREAAEETADSGLPAGDDTLDWADASEPQLTSTAFDSSPGAEPDPVQQQTPASTSEEKAVQTDVVPSPPELQALLLHLLKLRDAGVLPEVPAEKWQNAETSGGPTSWMPLAAASPEGPNVGGSSSGQDPALLGGGSPVAKRHWSSSFLVDLAAVAAPALPTLAWLYCTHRAGTEPVYNIASLIRGCCVVGLRSLRRVSPASGV